MSRYLVNVWLSSSVQGDHFSENPENVTEFVSCQGKVRELTGSGKSQKGSCEGQLFIININLGATPVISMVWH